ncbi:MAG TPA: trigger factor [Chondromyces sp.]|nr:trigger factor [Chondromyces sp.]
MPYTLTRGANHTVAITATLDPEAVSRERQHIVRAMRRTARVPGFRPGKAPESAIRARFADEISSELEEHLTGILWREVFDAEHDIEPITNPQIRELAFADDGGFQFTAELEVRPRFELPELAGLELPVVPLEVAEAEVEGELAKIQEEHAVWEPAEEAAAEDGMLIEVDLEGQVEDSDEEPFREQDASFVLGSGSAPPEVDEALQGARVGDQRIATKVLPDDLKDAAKAGKTVTYTIAVKALKRKAVPKLDDDLATTIGLESLAQLRERVQAVLEQGKRAERRGVWRRFLLDHLSQEIDLGELPPSLVQGTLREQLDRYAYTLAMRGMGAGVDTINWQEIAAKAEPAARREVLDTLVLEQLAEAWETPVPEAEVDAYIAREAAQLSVPATEHKAKLAAEDRLERIRHAARVAATVDEMIRRAGGEVD